MNGNIKHLVIYAELKVAHLDDIDLINLLKVSHLHDARGKELTMVLRET